MICEKNEALYNVHIHTRNPRFLRRHSFGGEVYYLKDLYIRKCRYLQKQNKMDGFPPRTRSHPQSMAKRVKEVPWRFTVGTIVQAIHYKTGSKTEIEVRVGVVKAVDNISRNDPVYTVYFRKSGETSKMDHAELDMLMHTPSSPQAPQHVVRFHVTPADEDWYWNSTPPFDVEEEYGDDSM